MNIPPKVGQETFGGILLIERLKIIRNGELFRNNEFLNLYKRSRFNFIKICTGR